MGQKLSFILNKILKKFLKLLEFYADSKNILIFFLYYKNVIPQASKGFSCFYSPIKSQFIKLIFYSLCQKSSTLPKTLVLAWFSSERKQNQEAHA